MQQKNSIFYRIKEYSGRGKYFKHETTERWLLELEIYLQRICWGESIEGRMQINGEAGKPD